MPKARDQDFLCADRFQNGEKDFRSGHNRIRPNR